MRDCTNYALWRSLALANRMLSNVVLPAALDKLLIRSMAGDQYGPPDNPTSSSLLHPVLLFSSPAGPSACIDTEFTVLPGRSFAWMWHYLQGAFQRRSPVVQGARAAKRLQTALILLQHGNNRQAYDSDISVATEQRTSSIQTLPAPHLWLVHAEA